MLGKPLLLPVLELRYARTFMRGNGLCVFECAIVGQVGRVAIVVPLVARLS